MDTSEQYIKMCKAAKEIQDLWEPTHGDYIQYRERIDILEWYATLKNPECTWLPRIDQLIEMSGMPWREFLFNVVEHNTGIGESPEIISMYVLMRTMYDKTWNGENWINIA